MHIVLGAPGSGKSTMADIVRTLLPGRVVLDWDGWMEPASALAGKEIRQHPETWVSYANIVKAAVLAIGPDRVLLFGVQTPAELSGWPAADWTVLDCNDEERAIRLRSRGEPESVIAEALDDAAVYRSLGLPIVDSTGRRPVEVAQQLAAIVAPL